MGFLTDTRRTSRGINRRNLIAVVGLLALAIVVLRRRSRSELVRIEIEGPDAADRSAAVAVEDVELESIEGIGPAYAARLREAGVEDVDDLVSVDADDLARDSGIAAGRIRTWVERARGRVDG